MRYSKFLTLFLSLVTALFILSFSIAVPILFRPFYYVQIGPLELEESAELSREEIMAAYNEMLDFCTGLNNEFSTGILKWSESGRAHFVDVRGLFLLDICIAVMTGMILLCWHFFKKKAGIRPYCFWGRGPEFWGSISLLIGFLLLGGLAALDFGRAFFVFHMIFFPGKENWIFDYDTDEIIKILPEVFFRNCAILILVCIMLFCVAFISIDLWKERKKKY